MPRTYQSRRRAESAAQTRNAIVEAAVKLHGLGITTLAAVAEEAGVSLPTVNKYFPTREDLFGACTHHIGQLLDVRMPDAFEAIEPPGKRLRAMVTHLFGLHEFTFGQSWTGYTLEAESEIFKTTMRGYEAMGDALADAITAMRRDASGPDDATTGFVRGLLGPLTYRALRLQGQLSHEQAVEQVTLALAARLKIDLADSE
jgi:AcrR family transcriptional regulator